MSVAKQRKEIPRMTQKKIYQEADSCCAFCQEREVSTLTIHHIDSNPEDNTEGNLILVCGNCHGRITHGILSPADVMLKKNELFWRGKSSEGRTRAPLSVVVDNSLIMGSVANSITNIFANKQSVKAPPHPPGTIGANPSLKAYVDYLIRRYYEYKKADASYGRRARFSHAVIHSNIQKALGGKTFYLPEGKFQELVEFLQHHIGQTIQGKVNHKRGVPNYHSFQEHIGKHGF